MRGDVSTDDSPEERRSGWWVLLREFLRRHPVVRIKGEHLLVHLFRPPRQAAFFIDGGELEIAFYVVGLHLENALEVPLGTNGARRSGPTAIHPPPYRRRLEHIDKAVPS